MIYPLPGINLNTFDYIRPMNTCKYIHVHIQTVNNLQLDGFIILQLTAEQLRNMALTYLSKAGRNIKNTTQSSAFQHFVSLQETKELKSILKQSNTKEKLYVLHQPTMLTPTSSRLTP